MPHSKEHEKALFKLITDKMISDGAISRTAYNLWFENCKIKNIDSNNIFLTVKANIASHGSGVQNCRIY